MGKYKVKLFEAPDVYTLESEVNKLLEHIEQTLEISYTEFIDYIETVGNGVYIKNPYFRAEVHGNTLYIRKMEADLAKIVDIMHENGFPYSLPKSLRS